LRYYDEGRFNLRKLNSKNLRDDIVGMNTVEEDLMLSVMPESPFRKPYWRWLLAGAGTRHVALRYADDWVRRARLWELRKRHKSNLRMGVVRLLDEDRLLVRNYIEAGVLADMSAQDLSTRTGIQIDIVEAYIALFFDVHARRRCVDWIGNVVIGYTDSPQGNEICKVWKWVGYRGGALALDLLVQATMSFDGECPIHFERRWSQEELFSARLCGAVLTLPWSAKGGLIRVFRRWKRYLKQTNDTGARCESSNLLALVTQLNPLLGGVLPKSRGVLIGDLQKYESNKKTHQRMASCEESLGCEAMSPVHQTRK
jgi:hypothetical protein